MKKFKKLLLVAMLLVSHFSYSQLLLNEGSNALTLNPNNNNVSPQQTERLRAISVISDVEENEKFISRLSSVDSMLILPKGISKKIGAVRYTIAIDSMHFKPNGAYLSAYAAIKFPGTTNPIAFGGKNLKFNPEGVIGGEQAKLMLLSDHTITINPNVKMILLGSENANWVSWNCGGFDRIHLKGKFVFNSSKVTPDAAKTSDPEVKATFEFEGSNLHEFICQVSITPFKITGIDDVRFEVINATVDYSELANAPNMIFPQGYTNPNLQQGSGLLEGETIDFNGANNMSNSNGSSMTNPQLWTGFYLQSLKVTLPPQLNKNNTSTEISVNNMLIDNMGFTGGFQVNNVFSTSQGSMSGWGFSLDQIGLNFVCNNLVSGNLSGKVAIPVDEVNSLNYSACVSKNQNSANLDYLFTLSPTNNINFDVFGATININNNSSILVSNVNNKFKPTAILNGYIGFNAPKLNSGQGKLTFQNLTIATDAPYITNGLFGLNLNVDALKCKYFNLSLNNLTLGIDQGKPKLMAGVGLGITDASSWDIGIATQINVVGKLEPTTNPKFANFGRLTLESCNVNGVNINFSAGPVALQGGLTFNDNHPVYGDGFFGNIFVNVVDVFSAPGISVGFGKKPSYKFFFLDVIVPGPIPIPSTPVIITNIVGGVSYHLKPNKTSESEFIALSSSYASNVGMSSPMNYTPSDTVGLGVKLGLNTLIGGSVKAGAMLQIVFNTSGSINNVNLKGNVQAMAGAVPITGNMDLNYNFPSKTFDGLFGIGATYYGLITGNGLLKIHSDPSNWHICFGRPSQPFTANMFLLANVNGYFMTGNNLETVSFANVPSGNREPAQLSNGNAMCLGAWMHAGLNMGSFNCNAFQVTPSFNFDMGFDGMIKDYGPNATCTNDGQTFGINGKYLQASAYLSLSGGLYLSGTYPKLSTCPQTFHPCGKGHCCCFTTNVPCIEHTTFNENILNCPTLTASLMAKLPKPLYFSGNFNLSYNFFWGAVNGSVNFNYHYGTNCVTP